MTSAPLRASIGIQNLLQLPKVQRFDFVEVRCQSFPYGTIDQRSHASSPFLSQSRNPPRKALALSPARQPGGREFSFLTLPPPSTTSSGSSAVLNRSTTSATSCRHFFLPYFCNPRRPM